MKIALHDADKENFSRKRKPFPNYALMKISAYHKSLGDTPENPDLPPDTVKGGTGYGLFTELPPEIDEMFPDYSIYPTCDYAIGYITRGCPNHCRWCVVPRKK